MTLYLGFALASLILALTPGPDMLMVITIAAREGFKSSLLFISGLISGVCFHALLLLLGIATLITQIPGALRLMAVFGVLYLAYLAWLTFQERHSRVQSEQAVTTGQTGNQSRYWRGVIMNISNPKVLLFFMAFFPQFAQLEKPGYGLRILLLSLVFMTVSYLAFTLVAWITAYGSQKQMTNPRYKTTMDWLSIVIFIALALWLFFDRVWL